VEETKVETAIENSNATTPTATIVAPTGRVIVVAGQV
jgi:hypothetical protein